MCSVGFWFCLDGGMRQTCISARLCAAVTELAQRTLKLAAHVSSMPDTPNGDPEALEAGESEMAGGMPAAQASQVRHWRGGQ